jgi:hypothetical protein
MIISSQTGCGKKCSVGGQPSTVQMADGRRIDLFDPRRASEAQEMFSMSGGTASPMPVLRLSRNCKLSICRILRPRMGTMGNDQGGITFMIGGNFSGGAEVSILS